LTKKLKWICPCS